jgi:hypothetical protein
LVFRNTKNWLSSQDTHRDPVRVTVFLALLVLSTWIEHPQVLSSLLRTPYLPGFSEPLLN